MSIAFAVGQRIRFLRCHLLGRGGTIRKVMDLDDGRQVLTISPDGSLECVERLNSGVRHAIEDDEQTIDFVPCASASEAVWKSP